VLKPTYTSAAVRKQQSMSNTKTFPDGIRVFKPNEKAPAFVKGEIVIKRKELQTWLNDQDDEVRLTIKESHKGSYYLEVNNYKPENKNTASFNAQAPGKKDELADDLPF